jgi:hypothetical protein
VTHSSSEPDGGRRVDPGTTRRVGMFSHLPQAEVFEPRRPAVGDGVDWHTAPFCDGVVEQPRTGRPGGTRG